MLCCTIWIPHCTVGWAGERVPRISAASRWRSGHIGAVKLKTAGDVRTTERPWGCGHRQTHTGFISIFYSTALKVINFVSAARPHLKQTWVSLWLFNVLFWMFCVVVFLSCPAGEVQGPDPSGPEDTTLTWCVLFLQIVTHQQRVLHAITLRWVSLNVSRDGIRHPVAAVNRDQYDLVYTVDLNLCVCHKITFMS